MEHERCIEPTPEGNLTILRDGSVTVLRFGGEINAWNIVTYRLEIFPLMERGEIRLVFNLKDLAGMYTTGGLGLLLEVKKRTQELGGDLVLVQPSKFMRKTLQVLGVQEFFKTFDSEEEAIRSFQ